MKVITIDREYGAGGHTIGRAVAQRLGVEFYDRDIIKGAAEQSGITVKEISKEEENISKTDAFLRAITPMSYDTKDAIFEYESKTIIELACKAPCVILGRCGSAVLGDAGIDSVNVFLHADIDFRTKRAAELLGEEDELEVRKTMKKIDSSRHAYFTHYTGHQWGTMREYDLSLNTGALGYDACIDIICKAVESAGE